MRKRDVAQGGTQGRKREDNMKQNRYYPINEEAAARAKEMYSITKYEAGSATAEYQQAVDKAATIAKEQKETVGTEYHEKIDRLLDVYARKLAENMNNKFSIGARVPSILIAGRGNFPVRKKEEQNVALQKNCMEWMEIQGLLDKIRSTGKGGISSDDPNAVKKLRDKLEGLEKLQKTRKAVNTYYRKHKTLEGCTLLPQEMLTELKESMDECGYNNPKPYPTFTLSNNNAEIRRLKARIEELEHKKDKDYPGWEFEGGKVAANIEANRLQIFFEERPDDSTRTELRKNGFRWAPSAKAWQRQLNNNAYFAARFVKAIQPLPKERKESD